MSPGNSDAYAGTQAAKTRKDASMNDSALLSARFTRSLGFKLSFPVSVIISLLVVL